MISLAQFMVVILMVLSVAGCVVIGGEHVDHDGWKDEQRENREAISKLAIGMSRDEVLDQLGTPSDSEAFTRDGEEVRVLFFRTRHRHSDGETTRDEATPLVFRDDVLVGWGEDIYRAQR